MATEELVNAGSGSIDALKSKMMKAKDAIAGMGAGAAAAPMGSKDMMGRDQPLETAEIAGAEVAGAAAGGEAGAMAGEAAAGAPAGDAGKEYDASGGYRFRINPDQSIVIVKSPKSQGGQLVTAAMKPKAYAAIAAELNKTYPELNLPIPKVPPASKPAVSEAAPSSSAVVEKTAPAASAIAPTDMPDFGGSTASPASPRGTEDLGETGPSADDKAQAPLLDAAKALGIELPIGVTVADVLGTVARDKGIPLERPQDWSQLRRDLLAGALLDDDVPAIQRLASAAPKLPRPTRAVE